MCDVFSVNCWWLWKEPMPLKITGLILVDVQWWHFVICFPMRRCFHSSVSRHFRRSCLKANKISKSEETMWFLKVCWCRLPRIIKISPCLTKLQLDKVGSFFWDTVYIHVACGHYLSENYSTKQQGRRSHRSWGVMTPHFSRQRGTGEDIIWE